MIYIQDNDYAKKKTGTVACAVILATGTVDIGCLQW